MPRLLLVDGSSYLYRAFHALPDLRNDAGEPTGALRGVVQMLRVLEKDYKAELRAVVFDAKGKTFRDDLYPDYKAQRAPMPEDLVRQIEPIHTAVRALGWHILCVPGVEADDVIGTLARQGEAAGLEVVISTGDKDLAQLVTPQVKLVNTMNNEVLDEAGVSAKFGVPPGRIVDYLALVGDTVDNVPGVAKVGPKTAVKWLQEYGSLEEIMARSGEFKGVTGENLRQHLGFLPLGRELVTVKCDVPLDVDLTDPATPLGAQTPDREGLLTLFRHYNFRSMLDELEGGATAPAPGGPAEAPSLPLETSGAHRAGYETILEEAQLIAWIQRLEAAPLAALDTETTSLESLEARLVGISFAVGEGEAAYLPLAHDGPDVPTQIPLTLALQLLRPWLESPRHRKVLQHAKYDQHVFANHGIALAGIDQDTLLESYVLEAGRFAAGGHDLGQLARRHLGLDTLPYEALCGKGVNQIGFNQVAVDKAAEYAAEDADLTLRVHRVLTPRLAAEPGLQRVYEEIELPARDVLFAMERTGVLIDTQLLAAQSQAMGLRLLELEQEAYGLAGQPFNLNSPKQLAEILFTRQQLPVKKKTPSGTPSTDEEVLSELALDYPLPKLLLEHRSLAKLKGTYCDKLPRMVNPRTGRVHTHFSQAVAVTGRLASSDPNLQNIPVRTPEGRRIRAAFVAPPGHRIVSADYSQVELRIMAHLSGDAGLLEAFAAGADIHRATAAEVFGVHTGEVSSEQRRAAKAINFGLIYGMSAFGLARQLGIERGAAQTYIDRYFARYPGVARYMDETRAQAREKGYVETVFGRRLWLPDLKASQAGRRQGAERAAINAPMQGTAADLIKLAMAAVHRWLDQEKLSSRLILQVHDELVLQVPEDELPRVQTEVARLMTGVGCAGQVSGVPALRVPLEVDVGVGANWDEAH